MIVIVSATSSFGLTQKSHFFNQPRYQNDHNSPKILSKKNFEATQRSLLVSKSSKTCECFDLHNELVPYGDAWDWQKSIVKEKKEMISRNEECFDTLILLQHYPVYTLGTASKEEYLNFDVSDSPYEIFRTERGGEVTYHGPGQVLVLYPIINLRNHKMDLHWYLRALEEVVIRVLSSAFDIKASRKEGLTGVWVGDEKLAAIGIRVMHWIAYHGLALNITTDLAPFDKIVPCGIRNHGVANMKGLLSHADDTQLMDVVSKSILKEFSEVFQLELEFVQRKPSFLCSIYDSMQV